MWHRGDRITGRDIFGFALIAQHEPEELMRHSEIMTRHAKVLFEQLEARYGPLKIQFEGVDTLNLINAAR